MGAAQVRRAAGNVGCGDEPVDAPGAALRAGGNDVQRGRRLPSPLTGDWAAATIAAARGRCRAAAVALVDGAPPSTHL